MDYKYRLIHNMKNLKDVIYNNITEASSEVYKIMCLNLSQNKVIYSKDCEFDDIISSDFINNTLNKAKFKYSNNDIDVIISLAKNRFTQQGTSVIWNGGSNNQLLIIVANDSIVK